MRQERVKWEEVDFRRVEVRDPTADAMLTALRKTNVQLANDRGVLFACFEANDPGKFDEAAKDDRHPNENSFVALIRNPSIRESLGDLEIGPNVQIPDLRILPLRIVEERLADRLRSGGFIGGMIWSVDEARQLSKGLLKAALNHRQPRVTAAITDTAWSSFFDDFGCDLTVLLCDFESRRFVILAVTDSD